MFGLEERVYFNGNSKKFHISNTKLDTEREIKKIFLLIHLMLGFFFTLQKLMVKRTIWPLNFCLPWGRYPSEQTNMWILYRPNLETLQLYSKCYKSYYLPQKGRDFSLSGILCISLLRAKYRGRIYSLAHFTEECGQDLIPSVLLILICMELKVYFSRNHQQMVSAKCSVPTKIWTSRWFQKIKCRIFWKEQCFLEIICKRYHATGR